MKFDKEFKRAISELPSTEKDKLIFRLLRRDEVLANRLLFELVSTDSVDDRRIDMEDRVKSQVKHITDKFHSPGYLMMDLRYLSGEITDHVKTTKDKFGEASLNLLMLNEALQLNNENIMQASRARSYKLCIYIIARVFKILMLIQALDEDFFMEFEEGLKSLGQLIGDNDALMRMAINNGLDVNWLISSNIPEDIVQIHKDIRSRGYLK